MYIGRHTKGVVTSSLSRLPAREYNSVTTQLQVSVTMPSEKFIVLFIKGHKHALVMHQSHVVQKLLIARQSPIVTQIPIQFRY